MAGGGGGTEENYWPGFVDALSNVVLTLVFVLVIFVFALVMASNKVEQKVQAITESEEKATTASVAQENQELKKEVQDLTAQLAAEQQQQVASTDSKKGAVNQNSMAPVNQDQVIAIQKAQDTNVGKGSISVTQSSNNVVLGYPLETAEMDQQSADQLGHVLDALEKNMGKHKVVIRSIIGKETYSAAKRLAYYRAVGARNYLITKLQEAPEDISVTIVQPTQPEDGRVEIRFDKQ